MPVLASQIIRTKLIILLIIVIITYVNCRPSGRGKTGRRVSHAFKNKLQSSSINQQSSALSKSNNRLLIQGATGGGAVLLVGALALRSYVSNNNTASIQSRPMLINGTGSLCINKENFSNFIFDEFRCPLSPIFAVNNRYCCGAYQQQYCCSFWESNGRAFGAIISIISACSLVFLFIICCIVYYRRYLTRKNINDRTNNMEQPAIIKRPTNCIPSDPPPSYSEAVRCLNQY